MHKTEGVFNMESLTCVLKHINTDHDTAEWQLVDETSGHALAIQGDTPVIGAVTLTMWTPNE